MINFLTQMPVLDFRSILEIWRNAGIFDIILPFLLIFSLVFAILEKSKILGHNRAIYAIIALAISFFSISNPYLTPFFAILFANAALGFAVLLVFILFIGFFIRGGEGSWWIWVGTLFGILIFFWVLGRSINDAGFQPLVYEFFYNNPGLWSSIIYGGAILAVIVLITLMTPKGEETMLESLIKKRH